MAEAADRVFLFLQGPHGPFYRRLAGALADRGARVRRVAFNAADMAEWGRAGPVDAWDGIGDYGAWITALMRRRGVTDLVVYGDTRPIHRTALDRADRLGVVTHRFEEGYIRPHWVTYERYGTNGASPARTIPLAAMMRCLGEAPAGTGAVPPHWGATRQHLAWSALYHGRLLWPSRRFGRYRGHRAVPLGREARYYLARLAGTPLRWAGRSWARRRLRRADPCYHLVLLQLSFDCSMAAFGPFGTNRELVDTLIAGFARGAPPHHHLVFRSHPFEDGREGLARSIRRAARDRGIGDRVHLLDGGGGLAGLLDGATGVVTVNSTAGQQALHRGLPLLALGEAVYTRPGLARREAAEAFFAEPVAPDAEHYATFRRFLLATSQVPGSFYSADGIGRALRALPDLMISAEDPYQRLIRRSEQEPATVIPIGVRGPAARKEAVRCL